MISSLPNYSDYSVGDLKARASNNTPPGWLLCDGSAVSRTTYADLFAEIGTNWGPGDGSTTFNLPDLRKRDLVGIDTTLKTIIDNCDGGWSSAQTTNDPPVRVVCSTDAADYKTSTRSAKMVVSANATAALLAYNAVTSISLAGKTTVALWIKCSVALNSGDFQFILHSAAPSGGPPKAYTSPLEQINIPAVPANTWTRVYLPLANPGNDTAIISIGLYQAVDKGACSIWVDDVATGNNFELGMYGGEATHKLTNPELSSHRHTQQATYWSTATAHPHNDSYLAQGPAEGNLGGSPFSSYVGSDLAHPNMQPYAAVNWYIKY